MEGRGMRKLLAGAQAAHPCFERSWGVFRKEKQAGDTPRRWFPVSVQPIVSQATSLHLTCFPSPTPTSALLLSAFLPGHR